MNEFNEETHEYIVDGKKVPSVTEIISLLTVEKYSGCNPGIISAAQKRGTDVHELCGLYDMDALPDVISPEYVPYVKAWADFCRDFRPQWLWIEKPLYSEKYAGTLDRIGIIDGKKCVVDIKTTSSMDRLSKLSLCCQLAGYEVLCRVNGIDTEFGAGIGVQLKKDGNYTVIPSKKTAEKYSIDPMQLFDCMLKINKSIRGEK